MSRQTKVPVALALAVLVGALGTASSASAGTFSTDFEAPAYTTGSINGQNGWQVTNPAFVQNVTSATALSGTQSFLRSNNTASGTFGDQVYSPSFGFYGESTAVHVTAGNNFVSATFWFRSANTVNDGSQTSVALSDVTGARMWNVGIYNNAGGGVNVFTSDVTDHGAGNAADFNSVTLASGLTPGSWYKITVDTQFVDGQSNDVVQYYLDDVLVHTGNTWEQYYRHDPEQTGNGNQIFAVDRLLFRTAVAPSTLGQFSDAGAQGFYFDDVSVNDPPSAAAAVPEPASALLLGLGIAGAACFRRRSRRDYSFSSSSTSSRTHAALKKLRL
jgi:hypothetical protein